ncbi:MAG: GNAT family N-acetyltransferase [Clostridia bacterium]|nr:GNAT family N-acetyltransferase [Clostridia bacterium]
MQKQLFPGLWTNTPASRYFHHPPVLETSRLILRPLRMRDARDLFSWCADPQVARYVLWSAHQSPRETRDYIRYMRHLYRERMPSSWGIVNRDGDQVIGTIGLMAWSPENSSCEIGYSLARECWGRGFMTEAASRLIRSLFEDLGVNRIEARHDLRNPASGRVLEKCGMLKEGVLRSGIINKGETVDIALWAILKSDFVP